MDREGTIRRDRAAAQLLRADEVMGLTGLRRSWMYEMVRVGRFPKPVAIGERARAWVAGEIEAWIADRIAERDAARDAA